MAEPHALWDKALRPYAASIKVGSRSSGGAQVEIVRILGIVRGRLAADALQPLQLVPVPCLV